jgi:hypothetical protein
MATFKDPRKLQAHLKKALDALTAEVLITTQAELGSTAVSPVDTGRFRSSWFAAEGSSSDAVAPEGSNSANNDATGLKIDSSKTYHLTNNLPYAQPIALGENLPHSWGGEARVVSKPKTWFKEFRDQRIPKIQAEAARQIKSEFGL